MQKTKEKKCKESEESKKTKHLQAQVASESAWRNFWQKGLEWCALLWGERKGRHQENQLWRCI